MRFVNTIEKHRREPGKSFSTYARERRLALAESIAARHKIYLDTKYWLLLRDYSLNRPAEPAIAKLSTLLHHGVTSGALICPVSGGIFAEISRQTDPKTLWKSVQLIDALSQGVSVLSLEDRIRMELLYFALTRRPGAPRYLSAKSFVWTKVAYVVGFATFVGTPFSREDELVMQKAFLDQMWEMSLSDMFDTIGFEQMRHMPQLPDFSHPLNAEKFGRAGRFPSLRKVLGSEFADLLTTIESDISEMFAHLDAQSTGSPPRDDGISRERARAFMALIREEFRLKKFSTELPTLRIPATLHAAILCDPSRRYEANDPEDFGHAETALPYFDLFLTEHSLRHLLTRGDLALDRLYGCRVVSRPEAAIAEIESLVGRQTMSRG